MNPIAFIHIRSFISGRWSWVACFTPYAVELHVDFCRVPPIERFYIEWLEVKQ